MNQVILNKQSESTEIKRDDIALPALFRLNFGGKITNGKLAYTLYGNAENPCVLVLGGISAGRDIAHETQCFASGWWHQHVGESQSIDLKEYCVLGIDYLGGAGDSSPVDPSNSEQKSAISTLDQAKAIVHLLKYLNICVLEAAVGSSYGGMVLLALISSFEHSIKRALIISAAHKSAVQSSALRYIQRSIVKLAKSSNQTEKGLELSRALGMITYRTPLEFEQRFLAKNTIDEEGYQSECANYLKARGKAFARDFSDDAFLTLSESIDLHSVDPKQLNVPFEVVAVEEDQLIPIHDCRDLAEQAGAQFISINSLYGHDAFLKESETIGWIIKRFLRG